MAQRPVYIPMLEGPVLVKTEMVEFQWFPGLAVSQKQKSITSLHRGILEQLGIKNILEVSSKSEDELGTNLSAFNLTFTTVKPEISMTVECAFQGSKVFESGGPYTDIFHKTSLEAKKDLRLKESGRLKQFQFFNSTWELEPQTAFYDWLYINALNKNNSFREQVLNYDAFTDIEFNPVKSINCQAYAVALFVSLSKRNMLQETIKSQANFLQAIHQSVISNANEDTSVQASLF